MLPSIGTLLQIAVVLLVVVGQLPQLDDRILYLVLNMEQFVILLFQSKVSFLDGISADLIIIITVFERAPAYASTKLCIVINNCYDIVIAYRIL